MQHECDSYVTFMALTITTILASNAKLLFLFIYFAKSIFSRLGIPIFVHLLSFLAFFLCNKSQIEYPTFMFLSISSHMFILMCMFEPLFMVFKFGALRTLCNMFICTLSSLSNPTLYWRIVTTLGKLQT